MTQRLATSESLSARPVSIPAGEATLRGALVSPGPAAGGVVVFAHGTGSGRHSPRNRVVADVLAAAGLAALLTDLLTEAEQRADAESGEIRFDVPLLAQRLLHACDWLENDRRTQGLPAGLYGASTGAAAALYAAEARPGQVEAVVSRGGRPDLAEDVLPHVKAPTLMIVGGNDRPVIEANRRAMRMLRTRKRLEVVPGATHLFEEPGTLAIVADLTRDWFLDHLSPSG
jgi:dienelactone hydrolase